MSWLKIAPDYRNWLGRVRLRSFDMLWRLDGLVLNRHRDRHTLLVELAASNGACRRGFLKKERRVPLRDRLRNLFAGFGFVSNAAREAVLLQELKEARIGCPEVMAVGEAGGRAVLMVAERVGMIELRHYLQRSKRPQERRRVAAGMGEDLARLHAAGFTHGDLYAKHVLVESLGAQPNFCFLDWQRGGRRHWNDSGRCRDLATLDASLGEALVSTRDRMICLARYSRRLTGSSSLGRRLLPEVRKLSEALQKRRRIREMRQPPITLAQRVQWLDGEALVVAADRSDMPTDFQDWLRPVPCAVSKRSHVEQTTLPLEGERQLTLVRRWVYQRGRGLWHWIRPPAYPSPEFEQACVIFRLQRQGLRLPRFLATGQSPCKSGQTFSFLLLEPCSGTRPLLDVLQDPEIASTTRSRLLREAGWMLRRIHDAGHALTESLRLDSWAVQETSSGESCMVLTSVAGLCERTRTSKHSIAQDLRFLRRQAGPRVNRAAMLRFVLGYLDLARLDVSGRHLWAIVAARSASAPREVAA